MNRHARFACILALSALPLAAGCHCKKGSDAGTDAGTDAATDSGDQPVCLTDQDCEDSDPACMTPGVLCRCNTLDDRCDPRPCSATADCPAAEAPAAGWTCIDGACQPTPAADGLCARAVAAQTIVSVGGTLVVAAEAVDPGGALVAGQTFTFSSSDPSVATVDPATGVVTAVGAGSADITASVVGGATSGCPDDTITVTVLPPVAAGDIRVLVVDAVTGSPLPGVDVVRDLDTSLPLTTGPDGTVTFPGAAGGGHNINVLSAAYQYVTIIDTTSTDILVSLVPRAPIFQPTPNGQACDETDADPANDCPAGYSCVGFSCRPDTCTPVPTLVSEACVSNPPLPPAVCSRGFDCVTGSCVPKPCALDSDCGLNGSSGGFVCDTVLGECAAPAPDPAAPTGPCPQDLFTLVNGVCAPIECDPNAALEELRCLPGFQCVGGGCQPDINGAIGCLDFSGAPLEAVGAGISGASLTGDLIDLEFNSLIGPNRPAFLDIPGLFTGPAGIPAGATVEINQQIATGPYEAFGTPGEHVLWTVSGRVNLIDLIPVLGPLIEGNVDIGIIIIGILPFFEDFYSGLVPGVVTGGPMVPVDLSLQVALGLRADIDVPMLPPTPPGASDPILTSLVLGGALQPVVGFVPLGLSAGVDDRLSPDGFVEVPPRIAMAPLHAGLEANSATRYALLNLALNFNDPIAVSGRLLFLAPGEALPATVTVGDYLDFAYGATVNVATRTIDLSGANPVPEEDMRRVTFRDAAGGSWQVYIKPGMDVTTIIDPSTVTSSATLLPYADLMQPTFAVTIIDLAGTLDFEGVVALDGQDLNRLSELTDAFSLINLP
jgi:hypothetical protein